MNICFLGGSFDPPHLGHLAIAKECLKKFDKFTINNEKKAKDLQEALQKEGFILSSLNKREKKRNPYSPFSNSLLLQDASSKLGFSR